MLIRLMQYITKNCKDGVPGSVVLGGDSCMRNVSLCPSAGIPDELFFTFICCTIVLVMFQKTESR